MLQIPFYDPSRSYEENYESGPFGAFADGKIFAQSREPQYDFLGQKVYLPFGIAAGPLTDSKYCKAAFEKGFDICVYKTVRSAFFPCHPFPNILAVKVTGDLTMEKARGKLVADNNYSEPLSITNSFGVPSKEPKVWQEDVKKAISYAGLGQVLVLSFMGTARENQTEKEFIADYVLAARLAKQTGAKILEMNLSCPNIGNEGLVCYNLEVTERICQAVRDEIGDTSLILKVGYYNCKKTPFSQNGVPLTSNYTLPRPNGQKQDGVSLQVCKLVKKTADLQIAEVYKQEKDLEKLVETSGKYAQAIAAINTIAAEIVDKNGSQALPGKNRVKSGVCGASIKWAGLEMMRKIKFKVQSSKLKVKIIGVGGVMKAEDYFEYINVGADAVMSATGAMWNPYLAQEIKNNL